MADVPLSNRPFAERLGEWLHFKDAPVLFSALNGDSGAVDRLSVTSAQAVELWETFARVREGLAASIAQRDISQTSPGLGETSAAEEGVVADVGPYQRRYLTHQREMSVRIAGLQASVRAALVEQSAPLRRLAVLDGVLDQTVLARKASLFAVIPCLLAKRFEQLRDAHPTCLAEADASTERQREEQSEAPPEGRRPDEAEQDGRPQWLATFHSDMQAVLLAELELRLQPVAGLITAFDHSILSTAPDHEASSNSE